MGTVNSAQCFILSPSGEPSPQAIQSIATPCGMVLPYKCRQHAGSWSLLPPSGGRRGWGWVQGKCLVDNHPPPSPLKGIEPICQATCASPCAGLIVQPFRCHKISPSPVTISVSGVLPSGRTSREVLALNNACGSARVVALKCAALTVAWFVPSLKRLRIRCRLLVLRGHGEAQPKTMQ